MHFSPGTVKSRQRCEDPHHNVPGELNQTPGSMELCARRSRKSYPREEIHEQAYDRLALARSWRSVDQANLGALGLVPDSRRPLPYGLQLI